MDDLKQSVQNAVYEQKDPLLIYKFEAFEMFKRFLGKLNDDIISFISKSELPSTGSKSGQSCPITTESADDANVKASKEEVGSTSQSRGKEIKAAAAAAQQN
jgi:preprotein translocase subunit SecA